ncbi:NagC family transcriptional regulator [Kineosporia sp. NBRC 101677]|uniref:ROK family protein n=1 Tax=Kineosporia sp. NBRC 101677 TaxID=3032197 RepID=UPI0024A35FC3|nr:ROK family protein [Kineosporia sp. NBRC 101677]GLY18781.1 NagC family transcriptional regulator [Kineosporia sp. NBRC 101677]
MIERKLLAGLDIGGSKVLAVAVDTGTPDGRARVVESVRLNTGLGPEGVVDTAARALTALARKLAARFDGRLDADPDGRLDNGAPALPRQLFSGVGIGIPGLVDAARGRITHAVNLGVGPGGLALAELLGRRLDLPVVVENDVNAAALGAASHLRLGRVDMAYLSIGTGIAAGIVLDGELRRGPHNAAGEIGHIPVDSAGPLCSCGQRGCLESVASGSAIAARWSTREGSDLPSGQDLFDAAAAGDLAARALRDEVADSLAAGVRMLALTVDVDLIVLGGGVAEIGEPLRHAVAKALDRQAAGSDFLRGLDLAARLTVVPRDQPVAAIGAALLAIDPPLSQIDPDAELVPGVLAGDLPA